MRIGPLAETILIFSRSVFQRHLFLWCQIGLLKQLLKTNQRCCNGNQNGTNYVNLFVGYIEYKFFSNHHRPKHDLYKRYIDNCVGATSSSEEGLNLFITSVNSFHPALKYTWEISENSLAFLDIKLQSTTTVLSTSVHLLIAVQRI